MFRESMVMKVPFFSTLANNIQEILKKSPEKKDLMSVLSDIAYDWRNIGESLEVPFGELQSLQYTSRPDVSKLSDTLQKWIDMQTSPVTWKTLLEILDTPPVNKPRIATTIREYLARDDVFKRYKELKDYHR